MDGDPGSIRGSLIEKLSQKASLSQKVFDNTFSVFGRLKEVLHEMSSEIDDALEEEGKDEVKIEYRDRGKFEAQLQIAEDILIFSMHSNVFEFNREHIIWQNSYVRDNRDNSYCGIIDYTIDFDLLVPPYDAVKIVSVDQLNTKIENSKIQTGKRLGYKFCSDDI